MEQEINLIWQKECFLLKLRSQEKEVFIWWRECIYVQKYIFLHDLTIPGNLQIQ